MYWANFLHIYQPAEQQPDILEAIIAQSYRPLLTNLKRRPQARITLNVNGVLLELFDKHGHRDLIDLLRELGASGQVEFTSSAKYHAFLPFLEEREILRQIKANNETNIFFLGSAFQPRGFFPPEMGYTEKLPPILESLGFEWLLLDEIACGGEVGQVDYRATYRIAGTKLKVFFRERRPSNLIMSAVVRSVASLEEALRTEIKSDRYLVTGMDGETFGHHRPGLEQLFFEIISSSGFNLVTISELAKLYPREIEVTPVVSTWASSKQDIENQIQFLSWSDPQNPIHAWQWQLVRLALDAVYALSPHVPGHERLRSQMDAALSSDHFWWASAKPWWSVEMIELGAYRLLSLIRSIPDLDPKKIRQAAEHYEKIISTAFEWQRSGKIRRMMQERNLIYKIPFKERTWSLGGEGGATYRAFLDMMRTLERKAGSRGEYEKAILWRDAVWRLEHKTDIYEAVNAIDLLRKEIPNEEVERIIEKYRADYRRLRGGQPEDRM